MPAGVSDGTSSRFCPRLGPAAELEAHESSLDGGQGLPKVDDLQTELGIGRCLSLELHVHRGIQRVAITGDFPEAQGNSGAQGICSKSTRRRGAVLQGRHPHTQFRVLGRRNGLPLQGQHLISYFSGVRHRIVGHGTNLPHAMVELRDVRIARGLARRARPWHWRATRRESTRGCAFPQAEFDGLPPVAVATGPRHPSNGCHS
ncbi:hypothetical protein B0H14DRAFT_1343585 [Mycena olivaceomarginata]|nr:hypothetical protein B0H14DRAFT_1343585 [Mycena olivaceomarginata]